VSTRLGQSESRHFCAGKCDLKVQASDRSIQVEQFPQYDQTSQMVDPHAEGVHLVQGQATSGDLGRFKTPSAAELHGQAMKGFHQAMSGSAIQGKRSGIGAA
jgi:hypothetical protein